MRIEAQTIDTQKNEESWLVLKLMKQSFAVNCQDVMGIFMAEDEITIMSGYSNHVRGVIDFRGAVLPLLELRSVLGLISFDQEHEEFNRMIDMRIGDHRNWVNELDRCVKEEDEFKLATDPHKCAFGKWYYNFQTDNTSVAFELSKIEDPHKKLHEMALHILECEHIEDHEEKIRKELEYLEKAEKEYMPKVVGLLEKMEKIYKDGYREMCIVLSNSENKMLGLLVDEVTVVEKLTPVDSEDLFNSAFSSSCINHVARAQNGKGEIFVLDREDLFKRLF